MIEGLAIIIAMSLPLSAVGWLAGAVVDRTGADAGVRARVWSLLTWAPVVAALTAPFMAVLPHGPAPGLRLLPEAVIGSRGAQLLGRLDGALTETPAVVELASGAVVAISTAGAAIALLRLALRHRRLARVIRAATPLARNDLEAAVTSKARALGVPAPALAVAEVDGPLLTGLRSPAILLPASLADAPTPLLAAICAHELAHLRRADPLRAGVETVLLALFWFNPALIDSQQRLATAREEVCDLVALDGASSAARRDYGQALLRTLRAAQPAPLAAAFIGQGRNPGMSRLRAIVKPPVRRRHAGLAVAAIVSVATAALGVGATAFAGQDRGGSVHLDGGERVLRVTADRTQILDEGRVRWFGRPKVVVESGDVSKLKVLLNGQPAPAGFRVDRVDPGSLSYIEGQAVETAPGRSIMVLNFVTRR